MKLNNQMIFFSLHFNFKINIKNDLMSIHCIIKGILIFNVSIKLKH